MPDLEQEQAVLTDDELGTIACWVRGIEKGIWNPTPACKKKVADILVRLVRALAGISSPGRPSAVDGRGEVPGGAREPLGSGESSVAPGPPPSDGHRCVSCGIGHHAGCDGNSSVYVGSSGSSVPCTCAEIGHTP